LTPTQHAVDLAVSIDAAPGYRRVSFDLSAFRGTTATIQFIGKEDGAKQTSFVIDDVQAEAQP
jgi:hypothetical protein